MSPVDLEAPAEEGTKMGIMVGFGWCVLCAGQNYIVRRISVL